MNLARLLISFALLAAGPAAAQTSDESITELQPLHVSAGRIVDLGIVQSKYAEPRRVVVWLPSGYKPDGPRYSVLYMHDGQNLFDQATAGYGMEWEVDEHLDRLIRQKEVKPTIVVGIWNTPKRLQEYVPSKAFAHLPQYMDRVRGLYGGDPLSDAYLRFIVDELRPMISQRFHVKTDRANTAIMGSSMGGLISLYAIDEYPDVFGAAGMMSTHWPLFLPTNGSKAITDQEYEVVSAAFETYLRGALPDPKRHRLYFDHGSETLDAIYARYQARVDAVVAARRYHPNKNWLTRNFPGQAHNERSWASRVDIPLRFLLPLEKSPISR